MSAVTEASKSFFEAIFPLIVVLILTKEEALPKQPWSSSLCLVVGSVKMVQTNPKRQKNKFRNHKKPP